MIGQDSPAALRAALEWQVAMGADEAVLDASVNRYALPDQPLAAKAAPAPVVLPLTPDQNPVAADNRTALAESGTLEALAELMAAVPTPLRATARRFVFADGNPAARVMIVGEAPGRDEDMEGRPFVGRAGQLLDRMLAAIGLSRTAPAPVDAVYITNVLPWRPEGNRTPEPAEVALFLPYLDQHIRLVAPDVLVLMGNTPCQALLGHGGITRIRGQWTTVHGHPTLPMVHPAYLLRNPAAKREAWADLLALKARLLA
jgi:uracil-DNA glycosylase